MLKKIIKRYGYYLLAFSLILVIGITVGVADLGQSAPKPDMDNSAPTATIPVQMISPIDGAEVLKWYSDSELFYNSTLKQWESHRGVDLMSASSLDVRSVLDGVVADCSYSYEEGYCVTIQHANGISTTYCSLKDSVLVEKGDSVKQGQKIGEVSTSASNESASGNHLHFQVALNGSYVDPANYITFENK